MHVATPETRHASTVAINGWAVLIEGRSGAGKSDLALRLIDRGATLVSDDYTVVVRSGDQLLARAPATIVGRIEVRGLGIIDLPVVSDVPVALVVRLDAEVARMPERCARRIMDVPVRELAIDAFAASAAIKVEMALRHEVEA